MSAIVDNTPLHEMVNLALATSEQLEARAQARKAKSDLYREKQRAKTRRWNKANPLRCRVMSLLGSKCAECGISDERVLQVDHIVPLAFSGERRGNTLNDVLACGGNGFQLLCANCHVVKTKEDNRRVRQWKRTISCV
jgi:5-methylcytosine-specific restriction endonuclease McrA